MKNTIYATAIDHDKYLNNTRMYLAISAETSEESIIRKVPQLVKMCSATDIERLISLALPGVVLSHLPSPPSAIPVKMKYQYFSLNQSGAAWEAITRARNFAATCSRRFSKSTNGVTYPVAAGGLKPMKLLNKPVWAEGMYLGPHNFQAQSRYFEDSLNFVTTSLWRDAYGFAGLQFDSDALRNGTSP